MIDKLPVEVVLRIVRFCSEDEKVKLKWPLYAYRRKDYLLRYLQICKSLRQALRPLFVRYWSTVRVNSENAGVGDAVREQLLKAIEGEEGLVEELEVSSQYVPNLLSFSNLTSLVILGSERMWLDIDIKLQHLSLTLKDTQLFRSVSVERLDLMIDSQNLTTLSSLSQFQDITELNICFQDCSYLVRSMELQYFLKSLGNLTKLSLLTSTLNNQLIPSIFLNEFQSFIDTVASLRRLKDFTVDLALIRQNVSVDELPQAVNPHKLDTFTIVEKAVSGPLTSLQVSMIASVMCALGDIQQFKFVYGKQTELAYNTALLIPKQIIAKYEERGFSIRKLYTTMMWNIIDDTQVWVDRLLSYEVNNNLSPDYKSVQKYDRNASGENDWIYSSSELDWAFLSVHCQFLYQKKFIRKKRSKLWNR